MTRLDQIQQQQQQIVRDLAQLKQQMGDRTTTSVSGKKTLIPWGSIEIIGGIARINLL